MVGVGCWVIIIYGCCGGYGDYSWELSSRRLIIRVMRKEREYNLIRPFWFVVVTEAFIWKWAIDFGSASSIHIWSRSREADF